MVEKIEEDIKKQVSTVDQFDEVNITKQFSFTSDLYTTDYEGLLTFEEYKQMYKKSIDNNEEFWAEQGKRIDWFKPYTKIKDCNYNQDDLHIKWYYDGTLNVSYNCIDRHIKNGKGDNIAIIWEGNCGQKDLKITYNQLLLKVCQLANALKNEGVKKGDVVTLYMPMIPEVVYAMLACTRIGAVHSIIFGGFSAHSVAGRIDDCNSEFIITADEAWRGAKTIHLKDSIDEAVKQCKTKVKKVIVVKDTGKAVNWDNEIDVWYHDIIKDVPTDCPCEEMGAEDPLFILYTSGSTGTPKGVLHTTGGYIVYASFTHQYVFGYRPGDIYWCTADCGWVTGHSYVVYGPLANCATTVIFEGVPNYPDNSRLWNIVDKHQINIIYTAPTLLRALMGAGDKFVQQTSRKSLKVLGSVGEPINPEAWLWYYNVVGEKRCPISDTWWQTETGGILISPLAGTTPLKPGSATFPFFGIKPVLVNKDNQILEGAVKGALCITDSWPGQMRTVYGNHQRFIKTYFSQFPGKYFSGDGCFRDEDGYLWITGRVDDIVIVSGHNISTAEIEHALVGHQSVAETALVGYPHKIKGFGLYAFVMLKNGVDGSEQLKKDLIQLIRKDIGAIANLDFIQFVNKGLPKTRSGKIMRRILRKIAANDFEDLGDTSTLADPTVVQDIVDHRLNKEGK